MFTGRVIAHECLMSSHLIWLLYFVEWYKRLCFVRPHLLYSCGVLLHMYTYGVDPQESTIRSKSIDVDPRGTRSLFNGDVASQIGRRSRQYEHISSPIMGYHVRSTVYSYVRSSRSSLINWLLITLYTGKKGKWCWLTRDKCFDNFPGIGQLSLDCVCSVGSANIVVFIYSLKGGDYKLKTLIRLFYFILISLTTIVQEFFILRIVICLMLLIRQSGPVKRSVINQLLETLLSLIPTMNSTNKQF